MSKPTVESILAQYKGRPVSELEAAFRKRVEENQGIQAQLSNMNRTDAQGNRQTGREYHEWRARAIVAWKHGVAEQRVMKEALKISRRRFNTDTPLRPAMTLKSADELIHAALVTLKRIAGDGVDIDDEEQQVIDALDTYLRDHGKVGA